MTLSALEAEQRARRSRARRIEMALRDLLKAIDEDDPVHGGGELQPIRCPVCAAIRNARIALGDISEQ